MRLLLLSLMSLLILSSCEQERPWTNLSKEVMEIHDEVMPKMDQIVDLQQRLKHFQMTNKVDSTSGIHQEVESGLKRLVAADEAMWEWMHAFKLPTQHDERPDKEITAFLEDEKVKIQEVADKMNSSIENGQRLVKEINK